MAAREQDVLRRAGEVSVLILAPSPHPVTPCRSIQGIAHARSC